MDDRLAQIQKLLDAADGNLSSARTMMREMTAGDSTPLDMDEKLEKVNASEGKVIEGVFDGEQMVVPDGKTYPVPPNYASKSKLVEGDTLKLTIADDGSFVFKQIAPVERRNAIGTLAVDGANYTISAEGKSYKVLTASVTFYKAEPGDQVTIVLPKEHDAVWAVMENVIKKATDSEPVDQLASESELPVPVIPATPILSSPTSQIESESVDRESALAKQDSLLQGNDTDILKPVQDDVKEEPVTPPTVEPEIEFPAGALEISDEQLLENLKNNLKNIEQPAYTLPENAAPKPVDNIVANDLEQINKTTSAQPEPDDKPIAELDI